MSSGTHVSLDNQNPGGQRRRQCPVCPKIIAFSSCQNFFRRLNSGKHTVHKDIDGGNVEIRVNNLTGLLCTVMGDPTWRISSVRAAVFLQTGVPLVKQKLVAGTSILKDTDLLSDLLSSSDQVVELMLIQVPKAKIRRGRNESLLFGADCKVLSNREKVLEAVQDCGYDLQYVPAFQNDRDLVLAAVEANGMALQYAAKDLQADKGVVLAAVTCDAFALKHAEASLTEDREIVLAAIQGMGSHRDALRLASPQLRGDRHVALAAVQAHGYALEYVSEPLRADRQIVEAAVRQVGLHVLKFADPAVAAAIRQEHGQQL